jgi:hypothetical protein
MQRRTSPRRTVLVALAVVVLVLSATPSASASPRPVPVCGPCSDRLLGGAADARDLSVSVESSTATVRVHDDTAERWTVRVELAGSDVEALREDTELATDLVEDAVFRDATAVTARVAGDTLVARYRTVEFATRSSGAYRLDGLRDEAGRVRYTGLGADRLTVVGPEGTVAALSPPGAAVDGRRVTFSELSDGWTVFAPDGPAAPLVAALAVADAVGATLVSNAVGLLVVPGLLLVGGLTALRRLVERLGDPPSVARRALAVVALGLLAVAHPLLGDAQLLGTGYAPPLVAGGVAALAVGSVAATRGRLSVELATATAVGGFLFGVVAAVALPSVLGGLGHAPDGFGDALAASLPALPVVCCFPFGVAGAARRRYGVVLVLVAFALVVVTAFDLSTADPFGLLWTVFALGGAVVTALVGLPFVALGRAVRPRHVDAASG